MQKQLTALAGAVVLATTFGTATTTLAGPREVRRAVAHVFNGRGELKGVRLSKHTFNIRHNTRIFNSGTSRCMQWNYSHQLRFRKDDIVYVTACGSRGTITRLEQKIKRGGVLATLQMAASPLSALGVPYVNQLGSIDGVYHKVTGKLRSLQGNKWETEAAGFDAAVAAQFVKIYAPAPRQARR